MKSIVAIGELLVDFTPVKSENEYPCFNALPGGAPCNFLSACSVNGVESSFIGKVGNDAFGHFLAETLDSVGVKTNGVVFADDVFTTLAFVTLDENGERNFSFARKPGADTCLSESEINYGIIDNCDAFHFGTLSLTDEPSLSAVIRAVEYAKKTGKIITFDPNYREKLWKSKADAIDAIKKGLFLADIVKISDDEALLVTGKQPKQAAREIVNNYNVPVVAVTCGEKGCVWATVDGSGSVDVSGNVSTIDTTGAGDIFGGFFVSYILNNNGYSHGFCDLPVINKAALYAVKYATLSTGFHGGISAVKELKKIMIKETKHQGEKQ